MSVVMRLYSNRWRDAMSLICISFFSGESIFYCIKKVPNAFDSRALTDEKPCTKNEICALFRHGESTFNKLVPGLLNNSSKHSCLFLFEHSTTNW